jgi:hypothetical protein
MDQRTDYLGKLEKVLSYLGPFQDFKYPEKDALEKLLATLTKIPQIPRALFEYPQPEKLVEEILPLMKDAISNLEFQDESQKRFETKILSINAEQLLRDWKIKDQEWFLPRYFGLRKIKLEVQSYLIQKEKLQANEIPKILFEIDQFNQRKKSLENNQGILKELGVFENLGSQSYLKQLIQGVSLLPEFDHALRKLSQTSSDLKQLKSKIYELNYSSDGKWANLSSQLLIQAKKEQEAKEKLEDNMAPR